MQLSRHTSLGVPKVSPAWTVIRVLGTRSVVTTSRAASGSQPAVTKNTVNVHTYCPLGSNILSLDSELCFSAIQ